MTADCGATVDFLVAGVGANADVADDERRRAVHRLEMWQDLRRRRWLTEALLLLEYVILYFLMASELRSKYYEMTKNAISISKRAMLCSLSLSWKWKVLVVLLEPL